MKPLSTAEEARAQAEVAQRIPGTQSYRPPDGGGPVGREAIEAEAAEFGGHHNLEQATEIEKEGDHDSQTPGGSLMSPK